MSRNLVWIFLVCSFFANAQSVQVLQADLDVEIEKLFLLNSISEETNLSITPSGNTLFFMSDRGGMPWSVKWNTPGPPRYDGDIWYSKRVNGKWTKAKCLSGVVNTDSGEDEPNVSPDGKRVYYQSWRDSWLENGGPYYYSTMNGTFWSAPRGMGGGIHRFFVQNYHKYSGYATDGMAVSPDGNRFIVACGSDYYGNMDLYLSEKNEYGEWSYPVRLPLSTPRNERSVFFGSDSRTIYFSSNGYGGSGGLDIFKTTIEKGGKHGPIVNLGPRFNTRSDDYGFIISGEGKEAFFVRDGDIYLAKIKDGVEGLKPKPTALVKGTVKYTNGTPISLKVSLIPQNSKEARLTVFSDAENGEYSLFVVDPSVPYDIEVEVDGLPIETQTATFAKDKLYSEVVIDFRLPVNEEERQNDWMMAMGGGEERLAFEDIPVVKRKVFSYIYFEFGTERLSIKERFRLNRIVRFLKDNPSQTVMVSGYSDMRGSRAFKESIARKRAESVMNYLMDKGIPGHRIKGEFYANAHHYGLNASSPYKGIRKVEISFPEKNLTCVPGQPVDVGSLDADQPTKAENQREWGLALVELKKKIEADPKNPAPYLERALVLSMKGDYDAALKDFDRALARKAKLPEVAAYRASVKEKMDDLQGALFDYNNILEREPKNALALFNRGNLKLRMGNKAGACRDWTKANRYAPGISDYQLRTHCP